MGSDRKRYKFLVIAFASFVVLFVTLLVFMQLNGHKLGNVEDDTSGNITTNSKASSPEDASEIDLKQDDQSVSGQKTSETSGTSLGEKEVHAPVDETAKQLLLAYKEQGDCVLVRSEYLDLFGRSWVCIVQGPKWVDMCYVVEKTRDEKAISSVKTIRMNVDEWREDALQTFG